jgi:hypothetical protein
VGDIDFKVNSTTENSNKFQKTRFWKEKSVDDVVTPWANCTGHTSEVWKERNAFNYNLMAPTIDLSSMN